MNKALFLDRDGVINVDKEYVHKIEDFEFMEGIFDTLRYFQDHGYLLIVITNQAGIGRGYFTEAQFQALTQWMMGESSLRNIDIRKVYYCPYHPQYGKGDYQQDSFDRKPNPGMILKAQKEFDLNLEHSILVGDNETDLMAGMRAGIKFNVLFGTAASRLELCYYHIKALPELIGLYETYIRLFM
ncbi:D-glycero-alpha-D-manno-heptose-1,7-bisphosphate 7-phosphatase [Paradesulfitobacterium ferrireducens]|uniref:D-glycero-alpha-D-manno-heptose-1,7-bisphosphate 7-phosphatase n=1 Tax=Paradesulfitobacterium ferrireducens TaxID=2816476 RepID=UPI001A9065AB|nr:HAD family hydrolase [Paradesulfitobacterium ferrireducens]